MSIPFIDLKKQRDRIRGRLDEAIAKVLDHGGFIMGPEVQELENHLATYAGVKHAVSCSSGTDALVMALMAKAVGPGDAVFVPSFTFVATVEAVVLVGATPVFVDVLEDTFNMDAVSLDRAINAVKQESLRPVGVIPVDLFGQPADYPTLQEVADRAGLFIIADAAQSFGASFDGAHVGALAEISTTSFFPAKPLGCYGDGGAIFTNDDNIADTLKSIRNHGQGVDRYDNVRIGVNGRLDSLQAAILIEKLGIFRDEITLRNQVAQRYIDGLADAVTVQVVDARAHSVWAQFTLVLNNRDDVQDRLQAQGIPTAIYYPRPNHLQAPYRNCLLAPGGLPVTERLMGRVLSLPMHPYLDAQTQGRIVDAVRAVI